MNIFRLLPANELITDIQELLFPVLQELGNKKSISNLKELTKNKWTHLDRTHRYRGDIAIPVAPKYEKENNNNNYYQITGATVMNRYYETIPVTLLFLNDDMIETRIPVSLKEIELDTLDYSHLKQETLPVYPAIKGTIDLEYYFNHIPELYEYIDETYHNFEIIIDNNTYYTIAALNDTQYLAVKPDETAAIHPVYLINIEKQTQKQLFASEEELLNHIKQQRLIRIKQF